MNKIKISAASFSQRLNHVKLSVENYSLCAVKRSNAYPGLTDAQVKGSAVLERVVEVIRTVGARPVDLNIFAAGEEISGA